MGSCCIKVRRTCDPYVPAPSPPLHIICFILNIFLPGIGTIIASVTSGPDLVEILIGVAQFFLAFIIIGFFWSWLWGYLIYVKVTDPRDDTGGTGEKASKVDQY